MRLLLPFLLFLALLNPLPAEVAVPSVHLFFPQFVVGGGWECELTLIGQGADRSTGLIWFLDQEGESLRVIVNGEDTIVPGYDLASGSAATYTIRRDDPSPQVGFILVDQGASARNHQGSIGGVLTYRYREGDETLLQIGVPASRSLYNTQIPYNNTGGNRTAFALLSTAQVPVNTILRDEAGASKGNSIIDFANFTQTAQFVDEIFPASRSTRGFLEFSSADAFQILVLNQNGALLSTSAALPGMLERDLTIRTPNATTDWRLRLVQEGYFLYGLTSLKDEDFYTLATGVRLGQVFQLNILDLSGAPGNMCLVSVSPDLNSVQGSVTVVASDGTVTETGTFELSKPSQAPF